MNHAVPEEKSAVRLTAMGYSEAEAHLVMRTAAMNSLPVEQFADNLMATSIHETGHQLMAVWQGCSSAKAHLSLVWPRRGSGSMISGQIVFSGLPSRLSSRQTIAVSGVVAEWLMRTSDAASEDEWDFFDSMRDCAWMSQDELELADGRITWHAVKRAKKLLQRRWNIVGLSSATKRRDLLSRLDSKTYASRTHGTSSDCDWRRASRVLGARTPSTAIQNL